MGRALSFALSTYKKLRRKFEPREQKKQIYRQQCNLIDNLSYRNDVH